MATQLDANKALSALLSNEAAVKLGDPNQQKESDPFQLALLKQVEQFGAEDTLNTFWPMIAGAFTGGGMGGMGGRLTRNPDGSYSGYLANGQRADGLFSVEGNIMTDEELVARWPDFPIAANYEEGATGRWLDQDWVMRDGLAWQTNGQRLGYPGLVVEGDSWGDRLFEQVARFAGSRINPIFGATLGYMMDMENQDEAEAYSRNLRG